MAFRPHWYHEAVADGQDRDVLFNEPLDGVLAHLPKWVKRLQAKTVHFTEKWIIHQIGAAYGWKHYFKLIKKFVLSGGV